MSMLESGRFRDTLLSGHSRTLDITEGLEAITGELRELQKQRENQTKIWEASLSSTNVT